MTRSRSGASGSSALAAVLAVGCSVAAHAQYVDLQFDSILDTQACGPVLTDRNGPLRYLAPEAVRTVPGPALLDDLRRYLNQLHHRFSLADDRTQPKHYCLGFYDDRRNPNAFAAGPEKLVLGETLTGMLLDEAKLRALMTSYVERTRQNPAVLVTLDVQPTEALRLVVTHEIAHTLQARHQLQFPGPTVRTLELHADCSAAFLMTFFSGAQNVSNEAQRRSAQFLALALGDHHFTEDDHHGTPAERLGAIQFGMVLATTALIQGWDDMDVSSRTVMALCSTQYQPVGGALPVPTVKPFVFRDVGNAPAGAAPRPAAVPPSDGALPRPAEGKPAPPVLRPLPPDLQPAPVKPKAAPVLLPPLPPLPPKADELERLKIPVKPKGPVLKGLSPPPPPVLKGLHPPPQAR